MSSSAGCGSATSPSRPEPARTRSAKKIPATRPTRPRRSPSARRTSPSSSCSARSTRRRSRRPASRSSKQLNLGSELIAHKALQAGKIDAYPEYTGTALTSFFKVKTADVPKDAEKAYEQTKEGFAKEDITALPKTPFENTFRRHMTKENAKKIGDVKTTSDLKGKEKDLAISGFPECKQRQDCLLGVEDTYGLKFGKFVASEQKYQVLDSGDADVVFGFTTDGDLAGGKYVTLDDDKKFFPPYNITFAIRNEALKTIGPEGQKVIEAVQSPLTEKVMQELNARVDIDKQKPAAVARA